MTNSPSATVTGPVGISVADARVDEGDGAVLAFLVTLSRAAGGTVAVDYATANGSAHAGVDYRAASGTLKFRGGESSKTVEVAVFDDSHDEGEETLTLRLSNASSGRVTDGEATGTIKNSDPLPRALLARFGRRRRCRWSSRWRRGWRRLASPGSGAGWRAASCGGAWSGTSRSA